ncbi:MAG: TetR/AcrR family transcriptional regulator [Gaiellaceae bacterium]
MSRQQAGRRSSDRRQAILDAAIKVIARSGVRGFRVEHVADEAQVAVSLLYHYFRSRNGLVQATLEHANERAEAVVRRGDSGRATVERTLLAELDPESRDTSVIWGEVLASAVFEPDLRDGLRTAANAWRDLIAGAIKDGHSDGSISPSVDPQTAAERLTTLVDGLSARWLAGIITRAQARRLLADAISLQLAGEQDPQPRRQSETAARPKTRGNRSGQFTTASSKGPNHDV